MPKPHFQPRWQRKDAMSQESVSANRYVNDQVARAMGEHRELDPTVLALTLSIYRTSGVFERAGQAELSPYDLTTSQFNILTVLHRADGAVTMRELGKLISVRPTNLTHLVDTLTQRNLIERRMNHADRRSFHVAITDAGEDFLAEFLPGHWRYLQRLLGGLSPEDRIELTRLLSRMEESTLNAMKVDDRDARASGAVRAGQTRQSVSST